MRSSGRKISYSDHSDREQVTLKWDELNNAAAMEMMGPPPACYLLDCENGWKQEYKRNAHEVKDILFSMCNANPPSFLPDIVWNFAKYAEKRTYTTHPQFKVIKTIYRQLVWEGIFLDNSVEVRPWGS